MRNLNVLLGTTLIGVTIMMVLLTVISIKYTNRMVSQYSTLVATSIDIKLNIATAHLWFEEIMAGDRSESMDTIWQHLEKSDRDIDTILEGEDNSIVDITPVENIRIRQDVLDVKRKLAVFSEITQERFVSKKNAGVGSPIDQKYDAIFIDLLNQMDKVINELLLLSRDDLEHFNFIQKILIILILLSGSVVSVLLHLYHKRLLYLLTKQLEINQE